ncbi:hypothetical protein [Rickettsiales endosymbiont of Stachyamoeba lipophora]|uniref:hypothetical protein n=1 Tax=Rickettsiales endosymbiont of Stachyamoeba lipophora TaxID=2486578 RepID=UPI000F646DA0|nr:hypothetical protein [Rickettsiales endosymbiont of Stachyamoeba lipophora]AZL15330.1 hypothetical protein EF513_02000 [Rickettsiales endosymbiont of Stachyamoeba lipophora]
MLQDALSNEPQVNDVIFKRVVAALNLLMAGMLPGVEPGSEEDRQAILHGHKAIDDFYEQIKDPNYKFLGKNTEELLKNSGLTDGDSSIQLEINKIVLSIVTMKAGEKKFVPSPILDQITVEKVFLITQGRSKI